MLGSFVRDWNRQRRPSGGQFSARRAITRAGDQQSGPGRADATDGTVTALGWLSTQSGVPEKTIENVAAGRWKTTELRIADALVTAVGRPEAFHDGTLEVRPNPSAPREARAECCGGSLTGEG